MFVLFGINGAGRAEKVTASDDKGALRRMWQVYRSAAIGEGGEVLEQKRSTDEKHAPLLERAIAADARAARMADRDAKPANMTQPAPTRAPAVVPEAPEAPAVPEAEQVATSHAPREEPEAASPAPVTTTAPAEDDAPEDDAAPQFGLGNEVITPDTMCPMPRCTSASAPHRPTLSEALRPLCKGCRHKVQRERSKGAPLDLALETIVRRAKGTPAPVRPAEPTSTHAAQVIRHLRAVEPAAPAVEPLAPTSDGEPCVLRIAPQTEPRFVDLNGIFDRLDALATPAAGDVVHPEALTRADLAAVLREFRDGVRHAFDVAIARLESPR